MATAPEHADETRAALREIVAEHGPGPLSETTMLAALLADLLPDAPRVTRLLISAAEIRISSMLLDHLAQGIDTVTSQNLAAAAFASATLYPPDVCAWVVSELSQALGVADEARVATITAGPASPLQSAVAPDAPPTITTDPPRPPAAPETAAPGLQPDDGTDGEVAGATSQPGSASQDSPPERDRAIRRRRLAITATVVLLAAGAGGAVAAMRPWVHPAPRPVLPPTGLTASGVTYTSALFTWSRPSHEPLPSQFEILEDHAKVGVVAGTTNDYLATGLSPGTGYSFEVMAIRGHRHSVLSAPLTITTTSTPPLSHARLSGRWTVGYSHDSPYSDFHLTGQLGPDSWHLTPDCATWRCAVNLKGLFQGYAFTARMLRHGTVYSGTATVNGWSYCNSPSYPDNAYITYHIKVSRAYAAGQHWMASRFAGTMNLYNPAAYSCSASGLTADIRGKL